MFPLPIIPSREGRKAEREKVPPPHEPLPQGEGEKGIEKSIFLTENRGRRYGKNQDQASIL
jgi:hypothetical protein